MNNFQVGDWVRIVDGPFEGFDGRTERVDDDRQVLHVSIMVLEKIIVIELLFTQVTRK